MRVAFVKHFWCLIMGVGVTIFSLSAHALTNPHQALYFTVKVNKYEIRLSDEADSARIKIRLHIPVEPINLMYDRPSTDIKQVSIEDFLEYLRRPENSNLNLSLMVTSLDNKTRHSVDFKVVKARFVPNDHVLELTAELNDFPEATKWRKHLMQKKILTGFNTVLYLDG